AVRWHPKGDRILYLDKTAEHRLNLFAFNLETKNTQRVFDHDAQAMVFEWDKTGRYLTVVTGELESVSVNINGPNGKVSGGDVPYRDLNWSSDGDRLGFVHGKDFGNLNILQVKDQQITEVRKADVVRFAGWDHAGKHLAYVVGEPIANDSPWSTLLLPEPGA